VILRGCFVGDALYFAARLVSPAFSGFVWFLADTGASRTTLLDRDVDLLKIPPQSLLLAPAPLVGIGGSAASYQIPDVVLTLGSEEPPWTEHLTLHAIRHDRERLSDEDRRRMLQLPSVLGRDVLNRFRFVCDASAGIVHLETK
jgi:hypothetical protein